MHRMLPPAITAAGIASTNSTLQPMAWAEVSLKDADEVGFGRMVMLFSCSVIHPIAFNTRLVLLPPTISSISSISILELENQTILVTPPSVCSEAVTPVANGPAGSPRLYPREELSVFI